MASWLDYVLWSVTLSAIWQQTLKGGAFSYRWAHVSLVFKNRMWVIGGNSFDVEMNDVWSSLDGKTWAWRAYGLEFQKPPLGHRRLGAEAGFE
jgi:hypothetical protein